MHAVVNRLRLKSRIPPEVWERAQAEVTPRAREVPGFQAMYVVEMSDDEVVLVIVADAPETLDRIATAAGNEFMRDHVIPHLAAPPDRQIGQVVAFGEA